MDTYRLTLFDPSELKMLRELLSRHSELAAAFADPDTDDDALERIYERLKDLEASITAEVHYLFDEEGN